MAGKLETTLNNGSVIPLIGLGTSQCDDVYTATCTAIDVGYRLVDTAAMYGNEAEVGRAIRDKIKSGVVNREELFIVTKLANDKHRTDAVKQGFDESLSLLALDYIDLYLMHWPVALVAGCTGPGEDGRLEFDDDADYLETWSAMEKLVQSKKVHSIGVSNFNKAQLSRLLDSCTIKPVVNQVECHLVHNQEALRTFCEQHQILLMAFSPLGSPGRSIIIKDSPRLIENEIIVQLAKKHNRTPGQILLRSIIQRNIIAIPKSANPMRIRENFDVFNFRLDSTDVELLNRQNKNQRLVWSALWAKSKFYPFNDDCSAL